tara:strand:+ start:601 stop:861 length:261 start_codon:yes stop_codon:yes gene_type:complete
MPVKVRDYEWVNIPFYGINVCRRLDRYTKCGEYCISKWEDNDYYFIRKRIELGNRFTDYFLLANGIYPLEFCRLKDATAYLKTIIK